MTQSIKYAISQGISVRTNLIIGFPNDEELIYTKLFTNRLSLQLWELKMCQHIILMPTQELNCSIT